MADKYLSEQTLKKKLAYIFRVYNFTPTKRKDIYAAIEKARITDVAPVVHGRWLTWEEQFPGLEPRRKNNLGVYCSSCHAHSDCISPYCPICGAKMD